MTRYVVDASVAIKWVIGEDDSADAAALLVASLASPDLLIAECANILWKKVRRGEITATEAGLAARLLARADVALVPMRDLLDAAVALAIALDHPAYDCVYLALARRLGVPFVTADGKFVRKVAASGTDTAILALADAAILLRA